MNSPRVSPDSNINWSNNAIQFPRLIAELSAIDGITETVVNNVAEAMDLDPSEVYQLIDRATVAWDDIKRRTCNPVRIKP